MDHRVLRAHIVIWGFVYGAAAMAGTGLPLASLFPVLSVTTWGVLSGLIGLALVFALAFAFAYDQLSSLLTNTF